MTRARGFLVLTALFAVAGSAAETREAGHDDAVRAIADVMSQLPLAAVENSLRAWAVERSADFGVVLIEVLGTIPLHLHPDGNRRMFLLEGRVRMRGGDHEMDMLPGDYMYLGRSHHHKVWLAPGTKRALLMLVDNPPTSAKNIVWLDPAPEMKMNPDQALSALRISDRCERAP
jgi:mannose-6-phosphate isomerase-like protein (cupin superfamily)